jgi:hypothetical protein
MVETFTPAVCGSRRRQWLALTGFALGAIGASALIGAVLGAIGAALGTQLSLVAAGLALAAAAREAGLVSFPLPQLRRQVPERWRFELPLPVWSVGYGAGLGAGFLTFQPVATFWVACAAAVALASPLAAALCFAAFGAGRAVMTAWPRRGHEDATSAVESLVRRRRLLLAANVSVLLVCAALLAAPSAGAATSQGIGSGFDPSARGTVLGRAQMDAGTRNVRVEPASGTPVVLANAWSPSVDGDLLAYADAGGIKIVEWKTGNRVAQVDGAVSKPSLDWPRLAFVRTDSSYRRLILANFTNPGAPTERRITKVVRRNDLGRPSLASGRLAWHKVTAGGSVIYLHVLATGKRRVVARSKVAVVANPSLSSARILWVKQYPRSCGVFTRRFDSRAVKRIYRTTEKTRLLWTTALKGRTAYVTQWSQKTGASTLVRVNF